MSHQYIHYEKKGHIAYVTIDRPEVRNALHPQASAELRDAFTNFRDDPDLWIAVLTGEGNQAFCAGNDLKYHAEHIRPGESYPESGKIPFGGITSDFTCWKPIIAAVNGHAIGGGLELAMSCDIIVAADHARLGLPETKVGLVAAAGGIHRLSKHIPHKIAVGMLLTGRQINTQAALQWGLINEAVPLNELMSTTNRWISEILEGAPLSVRASKQMAMIGLDLPLDEAMSRDYSEFEKAMASEDFIEGPSAFAEKRTPMWKGP